MTQAPATVGSCTINGGSSGVFSLTKDTSLDDRLARSPVIESVSDMALGHAVDTVFNNGPPPFGCQAGGDVSRPHSLAISVPRALPTLMT